MPIPSTPEMQQLVAEAYIAWMREQEQTIRDLLGKWVSEMEPTIIYGAGLPMQIKGIGIADDPTGAVIIENQKFVPGFFDAFLRKQ